MGQQLRGCLRPPFGAGETLRHEYRFRAKSGDYLWFRDEVRSPGEGANAEIVGCMIDITREKAAARGRDPFARRFHDAIDRIDKAFAAIAPDDRGLARNASPVRELGL